jgi:epsilon-lactone hydrolase
MSSWQMHILETYLKVNRRLSGNSEELDVARERTEVESMAKLFKPLGKIRSEPITVNGISAEWITPKEEREGRVLLFLHGGSFNSGSIASHRTLAGNVALACKARTLLIDYRLAPEHPFPAGIDDSICAYEWLLSQGFASDQIVVAGDSAGGTLTLNLLIHLRDHRKALPVAAVCLSPAPDLTFSGESWIYNTGRDLMLVEKKERKSVEIYLRDVDPHSALASPSFAYLHGLPPLLIQIGSHELLLSDAERFADKARSAGVAVTLDVWQGMQHEWQFAAKFLPEGRLAITRVGEFVETVFSLPNRTLLGSHA